MVRSGDLVCEVTKGIKHYTLVIHLKLALLSQLRVVAEAEELWLNISE